MGGSAEEEEEEEEADEAAACPLTATEQSKCPFSPQATQRTADMPSASPTAERRDVSAFHALADGGTINGDGTTTGVQWCGTP